MNDFFLNKERHLKHYRLGLRAYSGSVKSRLQSVVYRASSLESQVQSVKWRASCGERQVESVKWRASCGECQVESVMWRASSPEHQVENVMWRASSGEHQVESVKWIASGGERQAGMGSAECLMGGGGGAGVLHGTKCHVSILSSASGAEVAAGVAQGSEGTAPSGGQGKVFRI